MDTVDYVPYVGLLVGVLGRVVIPWLIAILDSDGPVPWEWRKAGAQILVGGLAFLGLVAANPQLPDLNWQQALALGLATAASGWGFADMGREVKKAATPEVE